MGLKIVTIKFYLCKQGIKDDIENELYYSNRMISMCGIS